MKNNPDFINDNLWKLLLKLSVPGILGMMVIAINGLVDVFYTSYFLGIEAFTGVSMLFPLLLVVTSITVFIAAGSASVLSRAIGANQIEIQKKVIPNLIAMSLLGTALITIPGIVFSNKIVSLLSVPEVLYKYALDYYDIYILGTFFNIYGLAVNALIRAEGKIDRAMRFTIISVVLNILLTPIFIGYFKMGVAGAAWSSVFTMMLYSLLTSLYFSKGNATFHTGKFKIKFEPAILKSVVGIGFSAFAMQLSNLFRQFLLFRLVAFYGTIESMAFFNATFRVFSFMAIPLLGLYQSMQPIIGINFGANKSTRCVEGVHIYRLAGIILGSALVIPVLIFPEVVINSMLPNKVLDETEIFNLKMIVCVLFVIPFSSSSVVLFQALGKVTLASLLPVGRQILLFLPLILVLTKYYAIQGIYYGLAIENVIYALVLWGISRTTLRQLETT